MKTENGVGCPVDTSLFWQAPGMGNICVDVAENIQTLDKGLDSKTIRFLYDLRSQMTLEIHSFSNNKGPRLYDRFKEIKEREKAKQDSKFWGI